MQQQNQADVEVDVLLQVLAAEHYEDAEMVATHTLRLNKFCCFVCVSLLYSCVSEARTTFCLNSGRVQLSCHPAD